MFSGIIEELGVIRGISRRGGNTVFEIEGDRAVGDVKPGDSICVDGVCLTVTAVSGKQVSFDAIPETARRSTLGGLKIMDKVNLERALKAGDRIGGHFVTGHVDCTGMIRTRRMQKGNLAFEISFPAEYMKYVIPKGSIAVDGISLTIAAARSNTVSVYIIPHTMANTTLSFKHPSDKVNLEFDILAKRRS